MSFLDEVNNVVMTGDKEKSIIEKIDNQKKHLLSSYASSIYTTIKQSIKEVASSGNFSNNVIDGEVAYKACAAIDFDGELSKLPLEKLNSYVINGCQDSAFIAHKSIGWNKLSLVLRLLDKSVIERCETYKRKVGIIFKRDKTVSYKSPCCKIFERETKMVIDEVTRQAKLDNIEIRGAFFRVAFLAHFSENEYHYAHSTGFTSDINIDKPFIRVDSSKVGYGYENISIDNYTEEPSSVFFQKQPQIVFKYSFML